MIKQLAAILLADGLVTPDQLATARDDRHPDGRGLGRVLVERGILTEAQLLRALAQQIGVPFLDLAEVSIDPVAVALVPATLCRRHTVLPIGFEEGHLLLAMADPINVFAVDDVRSLTRREPRPVVATREDLLAAIDRFCRADADLDEIGLALAEPEVEEDLARLKEAVEEPPIVKYVNVLITQAIQDRASDIHIEPEEENLRVRYRIDGVLYEVMRSPRSIQSGVISRLKIMSEIDIAEHRIPQDGRMSVAMAGQKIDLRVATLPTVWGEKVVLRILDNSTAQLALSDLGFTQANHDRYAASFTKPYGMILVTGPTGSGKSTTLYATLNVLAQPEINVITVEDPVEYRLPGINQVQVNVKNGLTFASALRAILRSDPDVVLVGEIRDQETAQIAIEASLTGHLVLSTLHTNDAPSAVTRLTEMGIEPFLVGSALECVLGQRLARKLCPRCRESYQPTAAELVAAGYPWAPGEDLPTLYRPAGCSACARTGYRGRLALHEVMPVSPDIERLTLTHASSTAIAQLARAEGMRSMREDGMSKVRDGATSIEEVLRIVA